MLRPARNHRNAMNGSKEKHHITQVRRWTVIHHRPCPIRQRFLMHHADMDGRRTRGGDLNWSHRWRARRDRDGAPAAQVTAGPGRSALVLVCLRSVRGAEDTAAGMHARHLDAARRNIWKPHGNQDKRNCPAPPDFQKTTGSHNLRHTSSSQQLPGHEALRRLADAWRGALPDFRKLRSHDLQHLKVRSCGRRSLRPQTTRVMAPLRRGLSATRASLPTPTSRWRRWPDTPTAP